MSDDPAASQRRYLATHRFVDLGLLQEINRRFLHPLGYALEVAVNEEGKARFTGVWDATDDPEGIAFDDDAIDLAKAEHVALLQRERHPARKKALGYIVQPVPRPPKKP